MARLPAKVQSTTKPLMAYIRQADANFGRDSKTAVEYEFTDRRFKRRTDTSVLYDFVNFIQLGGEILELGGRGLTLGDF